MWRCTFCLFLLTLRIDGKRAKRTHEMHLRAPTSANINWQTICDVRKKIFLSLDFDLFSEFGLFGKFRWHSGEVRKRFQERKVASEKESETSRATAKENYEKLSKLSLIFPKFSHFSHVFSPRSLLSTFSPFSKQLREILSFSHRKTRILRLFLFSFLPISVARSSRFPRRDN